MKKLVKFWQVGNVMFFKFLISEAGHFEIRIQLPDSRRLWLVAGYDKEGEFIDNKLPAEHYSIVNEMSR